jgi:hypothetical protein
MYGSSKCPDSYHGHYFTHQTNKVLGTPSIDEEKVLAAIDLMKQEMQ